MTQMIEKEGLVFHGKCIKSEIEALHNMILMSINDESQYYKVITFEDKAMESLEKTGYPKIIKPTVGSWGRMVSKLNDRDSAEGVIESRESMHPSYQMYFLEEFVQRPPRDIRAIVIGDVVAGAIYRVSNDSNWKTNTHLGGSAEVCEVSNELEDICIKAKNAVQGEIVGVDLMESNDKGLVVHEINNTTEFRNVVKVTGIDIPTQMLDYLKNSSR